MRTALVCFITAMMFSLGGVWIIGPNLGGAFWIIVVVSLLSPISASSADDQWSSFLAGLAASVGAAIGSLFLLVHDAFTAGQSLAVSAATIVVGFALMAIVRLLVLLRITPVLAATVVTVVALAWLSWPVWLSPWLTSPNSGDVASRLAAVHPLLSIDAVAQQFGFWTQGKLIYRLTTVGQNFQVSLPAGVTACLAFHVGVACVAMAPIGIRRMIERRKVPGS